MRGAWKAGKAALYLGHLILAASPPCFALSPPNLSDISDFKLTPGSAAALPSPLAASGATLADTRGDEVGTSDPRLDAPALPYGPEDRATIEPNPAPRRFNSFGAQLASVKWEMAAITGYYTAINGHKLFKDPVAPHVHKEGWFGKSTANLGVDKLAHAYSAYILSEIIHARLRRKTDDAPGIALTAAVLGSATMLYTELWDSIESDGGWSWEDVAFNSMGAGFSLLRNSIPELDKKLDFRLMIMPNSDIVTVAGKRHFEQQHYFFALKLAGFAALERSPLRFAELHLGYYGKDFTIEERARGVEPKRRIFVGVGINLRELFFKHARSPVGRAAGDVLDYFQPPYTALHRHITN